MIKRCSLFVLTFVLVAFRAIESFEFSVLVSNESIPSTQSHSTQAQSTNTNTQLNQHQHSQCHSFHRLAECQADFTTWAEAAVNPTERAQTTQNIMRFSVSTNPQRNKQSKKHTANSLANCIPTNTQTKRKNTTQNFKNCKKRTKCWATQKRRNYMIGIANPCTFLTHFILQTRTKRYGEAGLKGGGMSGGSDIFDMFFGGGRGGRGGGQRQRQKKAPAIREFLDVTLEDLYAGTTKFINYEKMTCCTECNGKGGKKVIECQECNGNGIQIVMKRMGYMTVQTQRECPHCKGEGTSIPESAKCRKCKGKGLNKQQKKYEFHIPRGSKHAEKVVVSGQGHEIPDAANGDLVIVLRCVKHELYQRIGADLAMTKKISLKEALCGFNILIPHVSGYKLRLKSEPNEVVQHGQLKAVFSKGMPQKGSGNTYGHLYVKFEIVFPEELDEETRQMIGKLLPMGADEIDPDEVEEEKEPMDEDEEEWDEEYEIHETAETVHGEPKVTPASARSAYDEDEDEGDGVQCKQM